MAEESNVYAAGVGHTAHWGWNDLEGMIAALEIVPADYKESDEPAAVHARNNRRAAIAARALLAYVDAPGVTGRNDDFEGQISDLFVDLAHLCDVLHLDVDDVVHRMHRDHGAETAGSDLV